MVKEWRVRLGLNQTELSEIMDIHQSCVSKIERGVRELKMSEAKRFLKVIRLSGCRVEIDDLY